MSEHLWWIRLAVFFGGLSLIVMWLFRKKWMITGSMLSLITLFLLAIVLPSARTARPQAQRNACLANLKQITNAMDQWVRENNKVQGDRVDLVSVVAHLKGGQMPTCPLGGFYLVKFVGKAPECSLPEHANNIPAYKP